METVLHRETGWLVGGSDPLDWSRAIRTVLQRHWDPEILGAAVQGFAPSVFEAEVVRWLAALGGPAAEGPGSIGAPQPELVGAGGIAG
jgi:hypothetical protein